MRSLKPSARPVSGWPTAKTLWSRPAPVSAGVVDRDYWPAACAPSA